MTHELPRPEATIELTLPVWLLGSVTENARLRTDQERLELVIEMSRRNVVERTGGPFAAAVFECESGLLVGAGVSRVEPLTCSIAHAEVMAIAFAQHRRARFDLGAVDLPRHELISSAQPCLMCAGATLWSGVARLVYAATKDDVEALVGFDEGPVPSDWTAAFGRRGVEVVAAPEMARRKACDALSLYAHGGGLVYNSRQGLGTR